MNATKKVLSNTTFIIVGNFVNKLISLLILIILTRHFDVSDFGKFSFVIFYITFFGIFTDLGLNTILVRECSRQPEKASKLLGNAIVIKFSYTVLSALASSLLIFLLGYPPDVRILVYIASLMLFISFRGIFFRMIFEVPFQVKLKMQYPSMINILNEIFTLGVIMTVIAFQGTLTQVVLAISLANLPGFLAIGYLSIKWIRPVFEIDMALIRKMVKEAFPVGISGLLESLFILLPVFFLSKLADDAAVGHYSLAFRLASALWIVPAAFMMSLFPFMSQYGNASHEELKKACLSGLKVMSFLAIPMAIVVIATSNSIVRLISGVAYESAAMALQFLIISTALYFLNTVFAYTLNAANLQNKNLVAWGVITILTLLSTAVLIPFWGFKGAAVSVVISLLGGFGSYAYMAAKELDIRHWKMLVKFLFAGLIMGFTMMLAGTQHLLLGTLFGLAVYIATGVILNILTKEDYITIRRLYARPSG